MWEAIRDILISQNAIIVILFIFIIILIITMLLRHGYITITTKAVQLGDTSDRERNIIRHQINWAHKFCTGICGKILLYDKNDSYHTKYVFERIYDEVIEWITLNHIRRDKLYIAYRQSDIWNLLHTFTLPEEYKSNEFRDRVFTWVEEIINRLCDIREMYAKYGKKYN